jgi:hypothetical protein
MDLISMTQTSPGQHFRDVQHLRRLVAHAPQLALDVQQAAQVAADHGLGAAGQHVVALASRQSPPRFAELDREGAAETAALLAPGHLLEFDAGHLRQQRTRLLLDAHAAQAAAGVVVGDAALVVARHLVDLEHGDQEIGQFVSARGQRRGTIAPGRFVGEHVRVFGADVVAAGPRGRHDIVEALELGDGLFRQQAMALGASPEFQAGWPQQVWVSGTTTSQPAVSSSFIAAKPMRGRIRSTRQVTNRPTPRH